MPRNGSGKLATAIPAAIPDGHDDRRARMGTVRTDIGCAHRQHGGGWPDPQSEGNWNWGGYSISNLATMTTTGAVATVGTMLTVGNGIPSPGAV